MSQISPSPAKPPVVKTSGCCSSCSPKPPEPKHHSHDDHGHSHDDHHGHSHSHGADDVWHRIGVFVCGILGIAGWIVAHWNLAPGLEKWLYALAVVAGAWPLVHGAWNALRSRSLDMNILMSVAVIGACILGDWGEAAALIFLYAVSEWLEEASVRRSQSAITSLMTLAPSRALVRRGGELHEIEADDVQIDEVFVVRAGERIPLDGVVVAGTSSVDQAPVTGESVPVDKSAGEEVFAGTLNGSGVLDVRATRPAQEGTTARIGRMVLEAQTQKSRRQRTVEKFALRYTPGVLIFATLAAIFPPLILGHAWNESVLRALALLVAACPCAFVLSGPVATICALSAAAKRGVLIRGSSALETLADVRAVAFDKTGTLTQGAPRVRDFVSLDSVSPEYSLSIAAALESHSDHPLARAVVDFAREKNTPSIELRDVQEIGGRGISGVADGKSFHIGRAELFSALNQEAQQAIETLQKSGRSVAVLGQGENALAAFGFADSMRSEARGVLESLKQGGVENRVVLSGDHEASVRDVANNAAADEFRAALLPEDKLNAMRELSTRYGTVAMVGDGINDAPALALADVGIAMGAAGSDAAIEAADVALMNDDLSKLPLAIKIAKHARRVIAQNIVIALGMKLIFVAGLFAGLWGDYQLIGGVIADTGATLLVTANSLRLLRG